MQPASAFTMCPPVDTNEPENRMTTKQPTPDQVREARLALGMTQVQFGKMLYVTERAVRKWESNADSVNIGMLEWEKVQVALAEVA